MESQDWAGLPPLDTVSATCKGGCGAETTGATWCNTGCVWEAWIKNTAVTEDEAVLLAKVADTVCKITKTPIPPIDSLPELLGVLSALSKRNLLAFLVTDCGRAVEMFGTPPRRDVLWDTWLNLRDG